MASQEPEVDPGSSEKPSTPSNEVSSNPEQDDDNNAASERDEDTRKTEEDEKEAESPSNAGDGWQAVFSPEANAWYFWNSKTNETTWENPKQSKKAQAESASTSVPTTEPSTSSAPQPPLPSEEPTTSDGLPPIDPDLAWLDPSAAARGGSSTTSAQSARFNARTGRFQVDSKLTPDRISDYQRSHRQQEAYYDVKGWEQQLEGKGLKRGGDESENAEGSRKRPSSKQVEKFKQQKQEKKKKKLTSWLAN
ncbi:hypothetical protein JCM5350_004414 [Sporobolomyces pararoseus]